ncbi:hypothetical protein GCM10027297_06420 [Parahaliea aestuarii]
MITAVTRTDGNAAAHRYLLDYRSSKRFAAPGQFPIGELDAFIFGSNRIRINGQSAIEAINRVIMFKLVCHVSAAAP